MRSHATKPCDGVPFGQPPSHEAASLVGGGTKHCEEGAPEVIEGWRRGTVTPAPGSLSFAGSHTGRCEQQQPIPPGQRSR